MKKNVLMLVNGYGFGNATRALSIIDYLDEKITVKVLASGKAFAVISKEGNIECDELLQPEYVIINHKLSLLLTLFSFKNIFKIYHNYKKISLMVKFSRIDLVIVDSEYSYFLYKFLNFYKKNPETISINSSILSSRFRGAKESSLYFNQRVVEYLDFFINNFFSDHIICPGFFKKTIKKSKITFIPPVVRRDLFQLSNKSSIKKASKVLIIHNAYTWGKAIDYASLASKFKDLEFLIVGTEGNAGSNISYVENKYNLINEFIESGLVICAGGMGVLSELLILGNHFITIPLSGHFEQWINSNTVIRITNRAMLASVDNLHECLSILLNGQDRKCDLSIRENGAELIALHIQRS